MGDDLTTPKTKVHNGLPLHKPGSDIPFYACFFSLAGFYVLLVIALLVSNFVYATPADALAMLNNEEIRFSVVLTLVSCTISAILSVIVAVPIGYLFSRLKFRGKIIFDVLMDVPIVLPPLVVAFVC